MPHKDPAAKAAYFLAHSRLPAQRANQARRRAQPGYKEYLDPIQRKNVLQRYGMTPEDYEWLMLVQGNACAVCRSTNPNNGRGNKRLDVDHDHITGKVRGLLCRQCNVTLGQIEKVLRKPLLAESFKRYLDAAKAA